MKFQIQRSRAQKLQMAVVAFIGILLLQGCGPQKFSEVSEQASLTDSREKPVAKCSADPFFVSDFQTRVMVYEDSNGPLYDRVRVKFFKFPSQFHSFRFLATQIDANGNEGAQAVLRAQPEIKSGSGFQDLSPTFVNQTIRTELEKMSSEPIQNMNFEVLLPDSSEKWNVLTVGVYQSLESTPRSMSLLLPPIYSKPEHHAEGKSSFMQSLHPLKTLQNLSVSDARARMDAYCF
ncbi:MAG: hypothetical protein WCH11_00615 [Bdellovibrio sp.]